MQYDQELKYVPFSFSLCLHLLRFMALVPTRSQSMPSIEISPTSSQRDSSISSWWTAAKSRLAPAKEPLIAARQVIQETKEKEKHGKEAKIVEKERRRSTDWPAVPENKFNDLTLLSLVTPLKLSPKGVALCSAVPNAWGSKPSIQSPT